MALKKIQMEYMFRSSITLLYPLIATNNGLSTWFADIVDNRGDVYSFDWNGFTEEAKLLNIRPNHSIRFRWLDSQGKDEFFEMKLLYDELISQVSLIVTDFAEIDETDDIKLFWDTQVDSLRRVVGL